MEPGNVVAEPVAARAAPPSHAPSRPLRVLAPRGLADRSFPDPSFHFGTIAVGFDGSEQAQVALRTAIDLAKRTGAPLRILGVAETSIGFGLEGGPASKAEKSRLAERLERVAEEAGHVVEASSQVLGGFPSYAIPEAASDADLLVIGSRGHCGAARRLLLDSVAARVMRTASCPTLITR